MKQRVLALAAMCLLVLSMSVSAIDLRAPSPTYSLTFDGTTATCTVNIVADHNTDKISATVKLWHGSTCLDTWKQSSTSYLRFSESYDGVEVGQKYKMTVDYTIAGKSYDQLSASATC